MYQSTPKAFEVPLWYVGYHLLNAQPNPAMDFGDNHHASKQANKQATKASKQFSVYCYILQCACYLKYKIINSKQIKRKTTQKLDRYKNLE